MHPSRASMAALRRMPPSRYRYTPVRTMRKAAATAERLTPSPSDPLPPSSSSSPSPSSSQPETHVLLRGSEARLGMLERSVLRLPRFVSHHEKQLFAPSLSLIHHIFIYWSLNAPQTLDLDLDEFLTGAKTAVQCALENANSLEFAAFVASLPTPTVTAQASQIVERVQSFSTPLCFENLQKCVQQSVVKNTFCEALDVQVESVCLTRAMYAQLTEQEYAQENELLRQTTAQGEEAEEEPTLERLQLQVEVRTLERVLHKTTNTTNKRAKNDATILQQRNVYVVRFTSRVTSPEDLDWRLAAIAVRTKGKPIVLSTDPIQQ